MCNCVTRNIKYNDLANSHISTKQLHANCNIKFFSNYNAKILKA